MNRRTLLLFSTLLGGLAPFAAAGAGAVDPAGPRAEPSRTRGDDDPDAPRTARADDDRRPATSPNPAAADRDEHPAQPARPRPASSGGPSTSRSTPACPTRRTTRRPASSTGSSAGPRRPPGTARRSPSSPPAGRRSAPITTPRSSTRSPRSSSGSSTPRPTSSRSASGSSPRPTPAWRYAVYKRLNLIGSGPQGQQIWSLDGRRRRDGPHPDAGLAGVPAARRQEVRDDQRPDPHDRTRPRPARSPAASSATAPVGQGFQPKAEELEEGVTLRLSPLLSYEGDTLDAAIELTANNVRSFHQTRVLAPREVGPGRAEDRRPRGVRDAAQPDDQGLAGRPDAPDLGGHPAGHPPVEGGPVQHEDPRHGADQHRVPRLHRRRARRRRRGRDGRGTVRARRVRPIRGAG